MEEKKLNQYELNNSNPFIEETITHVKTGEKMIFLSTNKNQMLVDPESGETTAHSVFAKKIEVDKAKFAKIYIDNLAQLFGLSKKAVRMFAYITSVLKPNHDFFIFSYEKCMNFTGYKSKASITSALKELIDNRFIARGQNKYLYFINPTIFFNGDRVTFLKQYRVRQQKANEKIQSNRQNQQGQIRQVQRQQSDEI